MITLVSAAEASSEVEAGLVVSGSGAAKAAPGAPVAAGSVAASVAGSGFAANRPTSPFGSDIPAPASVAGIVDTTMGWAVSAGIIWVTTGPGAMGINVMPWAGIACTIAG